MTTKFTYNNNQCYHNVLSISDLLTQIHCDVVAKLDHTHLLHLQLQECLLVYEFQCLLASVCDLVIFPHSVLASMCDLVIFPLFLIGTLC